MQPFSQVVVYRGMVQLFVNESLLLGLCECGRDAAAGDANADSDAVLIGPEKADALLRLVTPLGKLLSSKDAIAVSAEVMESFGGMGYCVDSSPSGAPNGIPMLLADLDAS